jgi:hypothetical protein
MVVPVGLLQLGLAQPRVEHPVVQDLAGTFHKIFKGNNMWSRYGYADPDPYQNITDPQHCMILYRRYLIFKKMDKLMVKSFVKSLKSLKIMNMYLLQFLQ